VNAVRRALWFLGTPVRASLVALIHLYQRTLSGWLGGQCRFYPTCSHYAEEAIRRHGAVKGSLLATWRVLRCNPYAKFGIDLVPPTRYDNVIQSPATGGKMRV
jgi:putative membrane protein insertion efficiency factor